MTGVNLSETAADLLELLSMTGLASKVRQSGPLRRLPPSQGTMGPLISLVFSVPLTKLILPHKCRRRGQVVGEVGGQRIGRPT